MTKNIQKIRKKKKTKVRDSSAKLTDATSKISRRSLRFIPMFLSGRVKTGDMSEELEVVLPRFKPAKDEAL